MNRLNILLLFEITSRLFALSLSPPQSSSPPRPTQQSSNIYQYSYTSIPHKVFTLHVKEHFIFLSIVFLYYNRLKSCQYGIIAYCGISSCL